MGWQWRDKPLWGELVQGFLEDHCVQAVLWWPIRIIGMHAALNMLIFSDKFIKVFFDCVNAYGAIEEEAELLKRHRNPEVRFRDWLILLFPGTCILIPRRTY